MTRRGWARVVLIGIVPVALAAACGTSGYAPSGADQPPASTGRPLVAELYRACSSRSAVIVERSATDHAPTPEQALTAYLALPDSQPLRAKLFEPARPPRSYKPVPSVPAHTPAGAVTTTTSTSSPPSPQWYARHDQKGRITNVIRMDNGTDGWAVTAVYSCTPGREPLSTSTTRAGFPSDTYPSATR